MAVYKIKLGIECACDDPLPNYYLDISSLLYVHTWGLSSEGGGEGADARLEFQHILTNFYYQRDSAGC